MPLSATIQSDAPSGEHHELKLEKTGKDTAVITLSTWVPGVSHSVKPSKARVVDVFKVRTNKSRTMLTCKGEMGFFDPAVTCTLKPAGVGTLPSISITIAAPFFGGTTDYVISEEDFAGLRKFLSDAAFPLE